MDIRSTLKILTGFTLLLALPCWPQTARLTQIVNQAPVSETLTATPSSNVEGSSVAFAAKVYGNAGGMPTGSVLFSLAPANGSTPYTLSAILAGGSASWNQVPPMGDYTVSAAYSGDLNYQPHIASAAGPVATLFHDFDFTLHTVSLKQGETWKASIAITPINGFTGHVIFSCSSVPQELACNFPTAVGLVTQATSVSSQGAAIAITTYPGDFIAASSLMFLFGFRSRKRLRRLACIGFTSLSLFAVIGCGSGGHVAWNPITPKGTYHVTINAVSGTLRHSKQLTIIVH